MTDIDECQNTLALAYQAGQHEALGDLLALVEPLIRGALFRYASGSRPLPSTLSIDDLRQQAYLSSAELVRRWDPASGNVGAYIRVGLPWDLLHYVRSVSPRHRSKHVSVVSVTDEALARLDRSDEDGRQWDDLLIARELLAGLDPIARQVVALHIVADLPMHAVAEQLGISPDYGWRIYKQALDRLRLMAGADRDLASLERLVTVLHDLSDRLGHLPGRAMICRAAGLSGMAYGRAMAALVDRGLILDRSKRRTGRLAYATVGESVDALRKLRPAA